MLKEYSLYACENAENFGVLQSQITFLVSSPFETQDFSLLNVATCISLGTLVPNSRDRHEKQW